MYHLQLGNYTYVGRTASTRPSRQWGGGLLHRWREDGWALASHRNAVVTLNQRRGRYLQMCMEQLHMHPTCVTLMSVRHDWGSAVEAPLISLARPNTNDIAKTFGARMLGSHPHNTNQRHNKNCRLREPSRKRDGYPIASSLHGESVPIWRNTGLATMLQS